MIHQSELLENILSRLPAKSIGRFRCVSKPWKSLLSQTGFIKLHLRRTKRLPRKEYSLMMVCDESLSLYSAPLKYAHQMSNDTSITTFATKLDFGDRKFSSEECLDTMASCDGLVLVKDVDEKLLLINPTTRESKEVPPSPYALQGFSNYTMYGLGYDSLIDDYKVVTLSYFDDPCYYDDDDDSNLDGTEVYVNVYYVKEGTWKKLENSPYDHIAGSGGSGVFVDAYLHWVVGCYSDVAAFDVQEEEFYETSPPEGQDYGSVNVAELGGCLCMFSKQPACEADIWVLEEFGDEESWTKFTTIESDNRTSFRPLCLLGKDQIVLLKYHDLRGGDLVMYYKDEGRLKDIVVQGISDMFDCNGTFLETLVSPHSTD